MGNTRPISWILPNGNNGSLGVYTKREGEEDEKRHTIRYSKNEKSIFVDDQSKLADRNQSKKDSAIVFEEGVFWVDPRNKTLLKFLRIHPLLKKQFDEVDDAKEATKALEKDDLIIELKYHIKQMSIQNKKMELESIAAVLEMSIPKVKKKSSNLFQKPY